MATDTKHQKQTLTFAQLCEAIADDKVATRREGGDYLLSARAIRRMERFEELEIPSELLAEFGAALNDASMQ